MKTNQVLSFEYKCLFRLAGVLESVVTPALLKMLSLTNSSAWWQMVSVLLFSLLSFLLILTKIWTLSWTILVDQQGMGAGMGDGTANGSWSPL